jgi:hypothetical protein
MRISSGPSRGASDRAHARGRGEHLFEARRIVYALVLGLAALVGPLSVVAFAHLSGSSDGSVRALGFVALIAADIALVFASRGRLRRRTSTDRNPATRWMLLAVAAVVVTIVAVPWFRGLFQLTATDARWLAAAALVGAAPVFVVAWLVPEMAGRSSHAPA